ncbi:MAG: NAD(P)-dependent alcohol dehydrogenase [Actinobacteria bacterium]|nr:MAG: NAD(P)-dependent alcohol dehydrogenase [Actinomycetota bacterium]
MKAIVQDKYGSAEVLRFEDIDPPEIGDNDVLVHVRAAGVDRGVWHFMTGLPYAGRIASGLRKPKIPVPGMDLAGIVETVGKNVTRFKPGDEVLGIGKFAFAEYARAPEKKLVSKPAVLTFEQAAVVSISGLPALHAVRDEAKVQPGQKVLIIGAAGGVGTYAIQIAKVYGAEVTAVCSTTKMDLVRSIGADHVIDYTREEFADGARHWDVIIDIAGNRSLSHLRRALSPRGTLVIVGGEDGGKWLGLGRPLMASLLSLFTSQRLRMLLPKERLEDIETLKDLAESGKITPVVERTYELSEAAEAIRRIEAGHARGKLVITV